MMNTFRTQFLSKCAAQLIAAAVIVALGSEVFGQRLAHEVPSEMEGIGIEERLNEKVPLDLTFVNEAGESVALRKYFEAGKPVILTLNYYTCPMLCHMTLNGLVEGLRDLRWNLGEEFQIVTVSINPNETSAQAKAFKGAYMRRYEREGAEAGWHFLVGEARNIKALADAVGFLYRYVPETREYAHSASIMFITPDGRISRYMNDVMFEARDLRLALVEASQGAIGSPMDRLLLFTCFQFDPDSNTYVAAAWKIMRAGGIVTVVGMLIGLTALWLIGSRHHRPKSETDGGSGGVQS